MHLAALLLASALAAQADSAITRMAVIEEFDLPESARYVPQLDLVFVSSINGGGAEKDGNGYISRVRPDGSIESKHFVMGGQGGVTLHAPKGMALVGDTLWVSDVDALRGFHIGSGAPVAVVDLAPLGAVFLNDVAAGPDGSIYISDTGIRFDPDSVRHPGPDRIFRVAPDRSVSVVLEGGELDRPNGVAWDPDGRRLLIVQLGSSRILAWRPGSAAAEVVASEGPGGYDGIEPFGQGRALVTSQNSEAILVLEDGELRPLVEGIGVRTADLGYDPGRRLVFLPTLGGNSLEIWRIR